jgi:hypothetical protein
MPHVKLRAASIVPLSASMTTSISGTNDIHLLAATSKNLVLLVVSQLHTL